MKKLLKNKKPEVLLFIFSLVFLLIIGIILSYNFKMGDNYNLLFDSDTGRVVDDAISLNANHYRSSVHPLFVLFVQPVVFFISSIILSKNLSLIILSALVSSTSIYFLYKILDIIKPNKKQNIIICLIYLFSLSNIIFTAGIETYNFATLFLILMWYFYLKQDNKQKSLYFYILLILFGVLSISFIITNVFIYLIMILLLLISKKINIKQIIIIGLITLCLSFGLSIGQRLVFHTTPLLFKIDTHEEIKFINKELNIKNKIKEVVVNDYYNSFIGNNVHLNINYGNSYNGQNYVIAFNNMSIFNFIIMTAFYIILIFLVARNIKKKKLFNIGLLLALLFNTILHIFYGNETAFLYSLHFVYLIIILFGINLLLEDNKKIKKYSFIFLLVFLIIEVLNNTLIFNNVMSYVKKIIEGNTLVNSIGLPLTILLELLVIILVIGIIIIGIKLIKKITNTKKKETKIILSLAIILLFFLTEWIFIGIENVEDYHKLLWIKLEDKNKNFSPIEKMDYVSNDFKKYFESELKELEEYKKELIDFKNEYQTIDSTAPSYSEYYYFGMANRRKLVYRPNKIIDVETKEVVYSFEEKDHFIIPNTYTVLIETKDKDFIMIKEDKYGVHYVVNGKDSIIKGTDKYLELFNFSNEKYQNMKKVLYGEILFNIKDSIIYPNIIVYNKPWYRDAALTTMVLQKTHNTDLIKDWVSQIEDIYDYQNGGEKEPDNLGELLYIISTQEEKNYDLIDRIEREAENIAKSNNNGYYIYGKTDTGDEFLYQNLWYKLGIESIGRKYHFNLDIIPEDAYSKMAWWSNYELIDTNNQFDGDCYPYLNIAERHKLKKGSIPINNNLYPLSWEVGATAANYDAYRGIDDHMSDVKVSPLHSWSASEFLLLLLEDYPSLQ